MVAKLVKPSAEYMQSFIEALREGYVRGVGKPMSEEAIALIENDCADYLKTLADFTGTVECPDGVVRDKVPSDDYWLVIEDTFIGAISLRHYLNDFLLQFGGHIGYGVRPCFQKQGYGTLVLRLGLEKARALGLERVLLTCNEKNIGSGKIIEANGGVLENIASYDWTENKSKRFWINL